MHKKFMVLAVQMYSNQKKNQVKKYATSLKLPGIDGRVAIKSGTEKPIECPLNGSMDKYLEFSLKNRNITPCNLSGKECKRIEDKINPLLERFEWSIKKR